MNRRPVLVLACALALALVALLGSAAASSGRGSNDAYDLPDAGVTLEGIGVDDRAQLLYVSGVNDGGRIYRGIVGSGRLEVWQPGNVDGRTTARGIDVDDSGNVFVAGGPTGRAFVYARSGELRSALSAPAGTFFNDVWVGTDGAAYVTNSNAPQIYRIAHEAGGTWSLALWLDATGTIPVTVGPGQFNLGGIVQTAGGEAFLVAQGNTGRLWRVDAATREVSEVDLGGASIATADGIVLSGHKLYVIRNFARLVTEIRLGGGYRAGKVVGEEPTPANRTFTTAKLVRGDLLAVDSQFGFPTAAWVAEDRIVPLDRP